MAADLFYLPFRPVIDANGLPVAGAKLYFYATGTTTPQAVYSTSALSTQLTNPVEANAAGVFPSIYLNDALDYRLVVKDTAGATLYDLDPYIAGVAGEKGDTGDTGATGTVTSNTGIVVDPSTVVSNSFSRIVLDQQAPTSGMTNSIGGNDAVNLRLIQNGGRSTQGPTGHANYYNTVFALGFNCTNSYTPLNTSMPSGSYRIESKFAQGQPTSPFLSEYHMASHFPVDWETAGEFRAVTATVPHNSEDWDSIECSVGQRGAVHLIWDHNRDIRVQYDFTSAVGGVIDYQDGGSGQGHPKLRFNTNNKVALEQMNAAGNALLPLPYRNNLDNYYFEQGAIYLVAETQSTPVGASAAMVINCTAASADQSALLISCPAVTGDFNVTNVSGAVTGGLISKIYNNGSGTSTLDLQVLNGAGNDAIVGFSNVAGGAVFTIGYDNSDGDKLKIEKSYRSVGNASNLFVEFDPTNNVCNFAKPPKLPSHTVATLPSAATVAAGAMAYATDLNATTAGSVAAGGGSNDGVVVSDGTNWRIMTAW